MSKKIQILFISLFMTIIVGVGGIQTIVELKRDKNVQMAHFFHDTFVTPLQRANQTNAIAKELSDSLSGYMQIIRSIVQVPSPDNQNAVSLSSLQDKTDNLLFKVNDLKKSVQQVNRHILLKESDSEIAGIDSAVALLKSIQDDLNKGDGLPRVTDYSTRLQDRVNTLAALYPPKSLASLPKISAKAFFTHTFFSADYLRAYEKEMENSSVVAKITRKWTQFVRYVLLRDVGEKAYNGKNGWLYYRQDVDYLVRPYIRDARSQVVDFNDKKTEDALKAVVTFKKQIEQFGADLLVVIIPGKPSIYPDVLVNSHSPEKTGLISQSQQFIRDLKAEGVDCVDLFEPFVKERANDSKAGDSLYLQTDTHWRGRAARLAAEVVSDRIRQYPWFQEGSTEYVIDTITIDREGDVGVMTQLPQLKIHSLAISFPLEKTTCYQVWEVKRDASGAEVGRTLYKDNFGTGAGILLLGDSFSRIYQTDEPRSAGWISHLAKELKQPLSTIVSDGGASTLVRQTLARKVNEAAREGRRTLLTGKKLVVWEFVERDLRFGAEGWKDVDLVTTTN